MNSKSSLPLFLLALSLLCPFVHAENVPKLINYQGKLTDSTGEAALPNGEYSVRFELFDAPQDGNLIWGEIRIITLIAGVFNVALGGDGSQPVANTAVNDLGFAFGSAERYLQTTVVSGPGVTEEQTLLPRQQMTSVPFAVEASNGVPPGTVVPFFGLSAPPGWIICAGQALARDGTYARLFASIGTSCGAPDGETFNVPDLRGRFLRGVDDPDGAGGDYLAAGRDPDAGARIRMKPGGNLGSVDPGIGTVQGDLFRSHRHPGSTFASADHKHWTSFGSDGGNIYSSNDRFGSRVVNVGGQHIPNVHFHPSLGPRRESSTDGPTTTASVLSEGGSETRPTNAACNFIIKY